MSDGMYDAYDEDFDDAPDLGDFVYIREEQVPEPDRMRSMFERKQTEPIRPYVKPPGSPGDTPDRCFGCGIRRLDEGRGLFCPECAIIDSRVAKCLVCGEYHSRKVTKCPGKLKRGRKKGEDK